MCEPSVVVIHGRGLLNMINLGTSLSGCGQEYVGKVLDAFVHARNVRNVYPTYMGDGARRRDGRISPA